MNRTAIATVPEGFCDGPTSSPESYTGHVGKDFLDLSLDTPLARRDVELDYFSKDEEAARALQELHNHPRSTESPNRAGAKRSRTQSIDNSLQEHVREMLNGRYRFETRWSDELVRSRSGTTAISPSQVAVRSTSTTSLGRKRVCCATEAVREYNQPGLGFAGPGMWEGILN